MRLVDKEGNTISNEKTKSRNLGTALNALTMHAFLNAAKLDENMKEIPKHQLNQQIARLRTTIDDEPSITLYMAFGLFLAINPETSHGIPAETMDKAFTIFMNIMNKIQ